mgnify:CR=1 FL=1
MSTVSNDVSPRYKNLISLLLFQKKTYFPPFLPKDLFFDLFYRKNYFLDNFLPKELFLRLLADLYFSRKTYVLLARACCIRDDLILFTISKTVGQSVSRTDS